MCRRYFWYSDSHVQDIQHLIIFNLRDYYCCFLLPLADKKFPVSPSWDDPLGFYQDSGDYLIPRNWGKNG